MVKMAKTEVATPDRGRFTISANIVITTYAITRSLIFGCTLLSIYIKKKDDILDANVMKMVNTRKVFEQPLGNTVQSIVFSFPGVLVLELITGVCGTIGVLYKKKALLVATVALSLLMVAVYIIYITLLVLVYLNVGDLYETLESYGDAYRRIRTNFMSDYYLNTVFDGFLEEIGCSGWRGDCYRVYIEQAQSYLQTYLGITATCLVSHVVSLIAVDYTYRKFQFKEVQTRLSSNTSYLLLSRNYGIGNAIVTTVRKTWKGSKGTFFSVATKIILLILHAGLLGLGLTLCGDVFITDGYLRYIFYRIQFFHYYFYDISVGLAASAVVIGILGIIQSAISLTAARMKLSSLYIGSCLVSSILILPKLLIVILYTIFLDEINRKMYFQLELQQDGYYFDDTQSRLTRSWNMMIMLLNCCGVHKYDDTFGSKYGSRFCLKDVDESRLDSWRSYVSTSSASSDYKQETCSWKIMWKTRMYIGWFLALLLLQITLGITSILLENREYLEHFPTPNLEESKSRFSMKCRKVLSIYILLWTKVKTVLWQNYKRSKALAVYLGSLGITFLLNICLLCITINVRYDYVFGNADVNRLLKTISFANIDLVTALDDWSIVLTTFTVAVITLTIYSTLILAARNYRFGLLLVGICLWIVVTITNVVEIGLWGKYMAEMKEPNNTFAVQLGREFPMYSHEQNSSYHSLSSFSWNTLFVTAKCCGLHNVTFKDTKWFTSSRKHGQQIPVQCCSSQTVIYPYHDAKDLPCTVNKTEINPQGCDVALENRLWNNYSTPFFTLSSLVLVAEIACIFTLVLLIMKKDEADVELISVNSMNYEVVSTELTGSYVNSETTAVFNKDIINTPKDIAEAHKDLDVKLTTESTSKV